MAKANKFQVAGLQWLPGLEPDPKYVKQAGGGKVVSPLETEGSAEISGTIEAS